VPLYFASEMM